MEEEEQAVFTQLISRFQHLSQLYASHSTSSPSLPISHSFFLRWCVYNLDENPLEERCNSDIMAAGKPGNFKMSDPCCKLPPTKKSRKARNIGKNLGSSDSSEIMEQKIWKELPEDLLEAVIARLPVSSFLRFRSVCRKWNSLLTSHSFPEHCAEVPKSQPWFYTITHENVNTAAIFDPTMKKWRHPNFPSLPSKVILLPVASACGLICFLDIGHQYFFVCNPLTRSWKELPARFLKDWNRVAVGMTQNGNSASEGYKIIWVGRDSEYAIYDSMKNSWSQAKNLPSSIIRLPLSFNFRSHTVSIGGMVYFMRVDSEGIVSYDMGRGVWKQYPIPAPPNSTDHCLAECGGRVYLVGLLTKNAATCVCVWELQKMTLLWKEVDRMPNVWCLEFYGRHVRMTCLGNKGLLMLSLRSRQMNRIVTYDVAKREWLKVPGCVLPRGRKRQWIACGTAFNPCLTSFP